MLRDRLSLWTGVPRSWGRMRTIAQAVVDVPFAPSQLFSSGIPGFHAETYDPNSLLARRNQFTYSEFPSGTANLNTAGTLVTSSTLTGYDGAIAVGWNGVDNQTAAKTLSTAYAGAQGVFSIVVKMDDGNAPVFGSATPSSAFNDFYMFAGANLTPTSYIVTDLGNGAYRVTFAGTVGTTANFGVSKLTSNSNRTFKTTAWHFEPNVTAFSTYQKVTDWYTEYLAAAGSANVGMWQDTAGTIPVTAVEQTVALWKDWKNGRGVAGNDASQATSASRPTLSARYNLLTKTNQQDDAVWAKTSTPTVTANSTTAPDGTVTANTLTGGGAIGSRIHQVVGVTANGSYRFRLYLKAGTSVLSRMALPLLTGTEMGVVEIAWTGAVASINSVSGFTNSLLEDLGSGWYTFSADATSTVTENQRFSIWPDVASGTGSIIVWGADLRTLNDAALDQPIYQRVNTSTDYDTDGFIHYLLFDGVDDSFQTPSIDFSTTDKVTVWAGVTKLSDAAAAVLAELGATSTTQSFAIFAPGTGAQPRFDFRSSGTSAALATTPASYPAPNSQVLCGVGDIASDITELYLNGVSVVSSVADQGTGNYMNGAFNIGRRNNSSVPYSGRLTSITARGAATVDPQFTEMNEYVAGKAGITL